MSCFKAVIRVDSSYILGSGHVMRCLTLADELRAKNFSITFICRDLPGNLIKYIGEREYAVHVLHRPSFEVTTDIHAENINQAYLSYLGVPQHEDAKESKLFLRDIHPDLLIVDHYALDKNWEQEIRLYVRKILVIDDLANREHVCDLLLDQSYCRKKKSYRGLVPQACTMMVGLEYALIRSEFLRWRSVSLKRRRSFKLRTLVICMGGSDPKSFSKEVLLELSNCELPVDLKVKVVLGFQTKNFESIKQIVNTLPFNVELIKGSDNIASIFTYADIAIGSAGITTWERCCLGLPSITISMADNQQFIIDEIDKRGISKKIDNIGELKGALEIIIRDYVKISLLSTLIINPTSTQDVIHLIHNKEGTKNVEFMAATSEDCEFLYSTQTQEIRRYSLNTVVPSYKEHSVWFEDKLNDNNAIILILVHSDEKVGFLRLDGITQSLIEISIAILPPFSGIGIAKRAIRQLVVRLAHRNFKARVHQENIPSKKLFIGQGFYLSRISGSFGEYVYNATSV